VEQVRFDDAYTFKYSVREGTPAVRIKDHVAEEIKTERIGPAHRAECGPTPPTLFIAPVCPARSFCGTQAPKLNT